MGYVTRKFLGEDYQISETVNEFLYYDSLLTPILGRLIQKISGSLSRDSGYSPSDCFYHISNDLEEYKKIITDGADLLVKKMFSLEIYDVTVNDLISNIKTFSDLEELELSIKRKMLKEGQKFVDMKEQGMEKAYRYAGRNITGSGISIFTNSFSALMIYSLVERNILLSQAKKADKEYQEAVRTISAKVNSGFEQMCKDILFGEYYPALIEIFTKFQTEIMGQFLEEITSHNKFDFKSIENYNMKKADDMLNNICHVSDKKEFLKQTFLICPFSSDLYEKCLEYGLLDKDTFETAKYFGMGDELAEKIDTYIRGNLNDTEIISPLIDILALYKGTDEVGIWKSMYEGTLKNIKDLYHVFNMAISDKRELDKFIRKYITPNMTEIVSKTRDDIICSINKTIKQVITEEKYTEFVKRGILSPEDIRMVGCSSVALSDINSEINTVLVDCVAEYIEEAKRRWLFYKQAKDVFDEEIRKKENELSALKAEKEKLGLFAFSKKKELSEKINSKTSEITEYKNIHEPKELLENFEKMYR